MVYAIDVHGAPELLWDMAPEEVELLTWDDMKYGIWSASHLAEEYAKGTASSAEQNGWIDIEKQDLDAAFEKSGKLTGKAWTTFTSRVNGLRVVAFDLFPTLRVSSVTDAATGQQLAWIQEDKDEDAQFFVILPKPIGAGERSAIVTSYAGKDAVSNEGQGNYYVSSGARRSWYPNNRSSDYALFAMRFAVPKGMTTIGTGTPVDSVNEGNQTITRWRSEQPQTVACFQFGRFKKANGKAGKLAFDVEAYANLEPPNFVKDLSNQIQAAQVGHGSTGDPTVDAAKTALDTINTGALLQKSLAEAQLAVPLFTEYFGPSPFKRLAVSQQTADYYGQSWPELVWLPITYFFDTTQRHQLNQLAGLLIDDPKGYFKSVAAHEIAHQWFGHTVSWGSYRDQWMSEGFAEMAASLYIQLIQQKPQEFIKFWDDERELLTERNKEGFRAIDVGPVTMGLRLETGKAGSIYRRLVYPKGGYILHMIRMMMWDSKTGDAEFKAFMQDFVRTYSGRVATTEDFKAMLEKHLPANMDVTRNGKMDWFFNEYVYGTALPHYTLDQSIANGELSFNITQAGVDNNFVMLVPLYLELKNGRVLRLGSATLVGNSSVNGKVPLGQLADSAKRGVINFYDDVLADK
jgi:aminopeptidase N